jgi:hypothetical protein
MLALVKKSTHQSELEWRITIAEHFGSSSLSMKIALSQVEEYSYYAQGALETIDVRFRPGGRAGFKPYAAIPFKTSALVRVVIGPNVESADLAVSTARRLLDRYGFRHTKVALSEHSSEVAVAEWADCFVDLGKEFGQARICSQNIWACRLGIPRCSR